MNAYGYDYYTPNENLYFDETSYLETIKPLDKIENFENEVNNLVEEDNSLYKAMLNKKNKVCNMIYDNFQKCHNAFKYKQFELQQANSQIFLLYIFLIFSIIFIFYQRMDINNLNQLIYILKMKTSLVEKK